MLNQEQGDVRSYTVLMHRDPETGVYLVDVPDLPGIITEGATKHEAIANASEAIRSHLAFLRREREPIPEPSYDVHSVPVPVQPLHVGWPCVALIPVPRPSAAAMSVARPSLSRKYSAVRQRQ